MEETTRSSPQAEKKKYKQDRTGIKKNISQNFILIANLVYLWHFFLNAGSSRVRTNAFKNRGLGGGRCIHMEKLDFTDVTFDNFKNVKTDIARYLNAIEMGRGS